MGYMAGHPFAYCSNLFFRQPTSEEPNVCAAHVTLESLDDFVNILIGYVAYHPELEVAVALSHACDKLLYSPAVHHA